MSKQSAGILLFRYKKGNLEFLLVHPGGPFFAKKDIGAWSIPKGEFVEEQPLVAAKRETQEEIGFSIVDDAKLIPLSPIKQKGGKVVFAWALEGNLETENVKSNTFEIGRRQPTGDKKSILENDKAEWFPTIIALEKINPAQANFIYELLGKLGMSNLVISKSEDTDLSEND